MNGKKVILLGSLAESLINFRKDLILELVKRGHRVIAVAPDMEDATAARLKALGVEGKCVSFSRTGMNPFSDLKGIARLLAFLRAEKPDALIAYTAKPVIYGLLAARLCGLKHATAMITGLGFAFTPGPGIRRKLARVAASALYRLALPGASHVVFQNDDDLSLFKANGFLDETQKLTIVNGSGVNLDDFASAPLPAPPHFLMIGRLLGAKGVREYAEASKQLRAAYPEATTSLVGWLDGGPDSVAQAELDQWCKGGMNFFGKMSDVRPAIKNANVVVLPSYREGTPRSVLEGMAMGRAIITTDAPGCRGTVAEGVNGFKVAPREVAPLTQAMLKLAQDKKLRSTMGKASRQRVEALYESHAVAIATADGLGF
ncbi:glycosyltransferase family 4 protein [Aestuariivirga litoralis]|uniref:glycosyltransferase family 4 protein n=1 Tax=Aestuariivirga litoralis TaxID=2650924 RepID=UPI0032B1DD0D